MPFTRNSESFPPELRAKFAQAEEKAIQMAGAFYSAVVALCEQLEIEEHAHSVHLNAVCGSLVLIHCEWDSGWAKSLRAEDPEAYQELMEHLADMRSAVFDAVIEALSRFEAQSN